MPTGDPPPPCPRCYDIGEFFTSEGRAWCTCAAGRRLSDPLPAAPASARFGLLMWRLTNERDAAATRLAIAEKCISDMETHIQLAEKCIAEMEANRGEIARRAAVAALAMVYDSPGGTKHIGKQIEQKCLDWDDARKEWVRK